MIRNSRVRYHHILNILFYLQIFLYITIIDKQVKYIYIFKYIMFGELEDWSAYLLWFCDDNKGINIVVYIAEVT